MGILRALHVAAPLLLLAACAGTATALHRIERAWPPGARLASAAPGRCLQCVQAGAALGG
ncbi:hypothetical protein AB0H83_10790 [Dactylosporangium sp. NPDC050688]|uniref:hypothetical protein n=1 Tax=Dactylosporangium sp. NPDC050688 TaxID=3157217 RepID=UPI0033C4A36B